jgi:hypothetical protein
LEITGPTNPDQAVGEEEDGVAELASHSGQLEHWVALAGGFDGALQVFQPFAGA